MKTFFVPGNVPSLKNSKSMVPGKGIFGSRTVAKYLQAIGVKRYSSGGKLVVDYVRRPNKFRKALQGFAPAGYPAKIGFHFVRATKKRWDFDNAVSILGDLMTAHGFIVDDDMDHMLPFPLAKNGQWYSVDKNKPGVYITILED